MDKIKINALVRSLIQSGKTTEVFELLRKQPIAAYIRQSLAIIEAEYYELRKEEARGLLSFEEKQIRRNRINSKLLALLEETPPLGRKIGLYRGYLLWIIPIGLVVIGLLIFWKMSPTPAVYVCPEFEETYNNKIMVLPFENLGKDIAKPQLVLRDRINKLTDKNNLSTIAKLGEPIEDLTINEAPDAAKKCNANVIIWGTYHNKADSMALILQYCFTEHPNWNNAGQLMEFKDITQLHNGRMLKDLDDAILSLCGIIALREGNNKIAEKWFDKVVQKEAIDRIALDVLESLIN